MEVVGESPHPHAAQHLETAHEIRQVLHPEQLVVTDQHERPARWHVLNIEKDRPGQLGSDVDGPVHDAGDPGARDRELGCCSGTHRRVSARPVGEGM